MFKASPLFDANYNSKSDVVVNQGGTSSGKTYSILQVLFCRAIEKKRVVITIAGQDIPNLKAGALRDALDIYNDSDDLQRLVSSYNKTDRIFNFRNGSIIEFNRYTFAFWSLAPILCKHRAVLRWLHSQIGNPAFRSLHPGHFRNS